MVTKTQERANYEIRRARTEIEVPHLDRRLVVAYPFYGPDNAAKNLRDKIRADGLREPTSGEVVSFLHVAYKRKEPEFQEATRLMDNRNFRAFTGILYDPETKLAYFVNFPDFDRNSIVTLDRDRVIERKESGDDSIRTVPFEHVRDGERKINELAEEPYIIAFAESKEGAEKVAEIADRTRERHGYIVVPNFSSLTKPEVRIASLIVGYVGGRLDILGYDLGRGYGYTFGVLDNQQETSLL
mgnify:FL=1